MSDNDTGEVKKVYSSKPAPPAPKPAPAPVQSWSHDHNSDVIGLMRASLEHDHGVAANDLPNSDDKVIDAWGAIVTKTGTFEDALQKLVGD